MGQVALGLRSLLVKLIVFVVMAALLAWALGGTLWPRAETVDLEAVRYDGRLWFWQVAVGGRDGDRMRWQLMVGRPGEPARAADDRRWALAAGPVLSGDGLWYAGCDSLDAAAPWRLECRSPEGVRRSLDLPDRLAVERQLARARRGLPVQDPETIRRQRALVLDPPPLDDR